MTNKLDIHGNSPFMTIGAADLLRTTGGSEQASMLRDSVNQERHTDDWAKKNLPLDNKKEKGKEKEISDALNFVTGNIFSRALQRQAIKNGRRAGDT